MEIYSGGVINVEKLLLEYCHPVGSLYISEKSTDPGTLFGGTWERIKDKFILAAGDSYAAGSTGGEASHTLTEAEMPGHKHWMIAVGITNKQGASGTTLGNFTMGGKWNTLANGGTADGYGDGTYTTSSTGGGAAHNNMPPYYTVYVWRRTA